jgi:hypothetical protein
MTVLKPRSRTISVRLSEEEFMALRRLCSLTGARSVSDLTRDAMRVFVNRLNREELVGVDIQEFRDHMMDLDKKVESLEAEIARKSQSSRPVIPTE